QRHVDGFDTTVAKRVKQRIGEVEPGGRRGNGTARARIHGLISIAIIGPIVPTDVGWQRNVADGVDRLVERHTLALQSDAAAAEESTLQYFSMNPDRVLFELHARPGFQLLTRM